MKKKKEKTFEELSIKERRKRLQQIVDETEGYSGTKGTDDLASEFVNPQPNTTELSLLRLIWSTEPMKIFDLCDALRREGKCPIKGDSQGWAILFITLGRLEANGWIYTSKKGKSIEFMQLSEEGANVVRDFADSNRPLLQVEIEEESEFDASQFKSNDPTIPF